MDKKLKLSLEDLKVQSFVTALSEEEQLLIKGAGVTQGTCSNATAGCTSTCPTTAAYSNGCTNGYCTCETNCSVTHCFG